MKVFGGLGGQKRECLWAVGVLMSKLEDVGDFLGLFERIGLEREHEIAELGTKLFFEGFEKFDIHIGLPVDQEDFLFGLGNAVQHRPPLGVVEPGGGAAGDPLDHVEFFDGEQMVEVADGVRAVEVIEGIIEAPAHFGKNGGHEISKHSGGDHGGDVTLELADPAGRPGPEMGPSGFIFDKVIEVVIALEVASVDLLEAIMNPVGPFGKVEQ